MPTNPNRFNPNPKRTTLSAPSDPRTDPRPQKAAQEEEKTRQALSNFRRKNTDMNEGIRALEAAIGEPAFRRLMEQGQMQVTSAESSLAVSSEPCSSNAADVIGELRRQQVDRIRRLIGPKLAQNLANGIKKEQKLHFALLNLREVRPKLFYAEWECQIFISIVGPSDIRKRSSGAIRIADQILSLDSTILGGDLFDSNNNNKNNNNNRRPTNGGGNARSRNDAPNNNNNDQRVHHQQNGQQQLLDRLGRAREFAEKYIEEAAHKEPPHLVLGLARQSAKIMAWSGNEQIGNRLSQLEESGEQDRLWMLKRALKKQNAHEKIVQLTGDWVQIQIVNLPNEPDGLGFGIVGGHSTGVVIKSIISGSVADKDQRLRPGDRILQIGHISTQGLNSQQIAALLRQQDGPVVQLTVGRPIQLQETEMETTPMCWTMATRAALTASTLEEEVQNRLELLANTPSTSSANAIAPNRCNGIQPYHRKSSSQNADNQQATAFAHQYQQQNAVGQPPHPPINEGTEFPDQLPRICAEQNVVDPEENRPSTSQGGPSERESGTHREGPKRNADKTHSNPLEAGASARRKNTHQRTSRGPSNDNPSCSSSSERRSLRQLQEMALTSFCRDKWLPGRYKVVDVELERDPKIGLGITVAGYVYRKEEINGVFIKSLVPQSSAHLSKQIQLHDLIVEVNGHSLEGLSHSDSVRTLIRSGLKVRLRLIRFEEETPQAKCLKMLHEQELAAAANASRAESGSSSTVNTSNRVAPGANAVTSNASTANPPTSISPVPPPSASIALAQHQQKQSLVDFKSFWSHRVGPDYDIVLVDLRPDERVEEDGGLGIEWQGTVDICDGNQLCSHHFIESLRPDGPAAKTGILKAGDELLQVNEITLFGESFVKVRNVLSRVRQEKSEFVRLIFCRKSEQDHLLNFVLPSPEQTLPLAYPLLASLMAAEEHFVKAKSELRLCDLVENDGTERGFLGQRPFAPKIKSRSVENLSGLAVWNCIPVVVALRKDAKGLGFSVADYQDPLHPEERVIVIRSLVPGGAAQADGRIVPGDRLLFVNAEDLSSSTLERAVEVLKAAPIGQIVRLGIAKPVPIEQCRLSTVPLISRSERLLAKSHSPLGRRRAAAAAGGGGGGRRTRDDLLAAQSHLLNAAIDPCCSSTAGSSQEEIWIGRSSLHSSQRCLNPQLYFPSSGTGSTPISPTSPLISAAQSPMQTTASAWTPCSSRSLSPCASPAASSLRGSWSYDIVFLPAHLERHIKVLKGSLPLGVVLDADTDKAINGCVAKSICSKKAVARDGRIQPGDYLVRINGESLRNVTNAQARAIMKRANLVGAQCNISYITASDARLWKERAQQLGGGQPPVGGAENAQQMAAQQQQFHHLEQSRLSPKVYPKFYRSPILDQQADRGIVPSSATTSGLPSPRAETEPSAIDGGAEMVEGGKGKEMERIEAESSQKLVVEMVERMMKDILSETLFDLYILWRRSDSLGPIPGAPCSSLAIPQQRSQRSASIGVAAGLGPSAPKEKGGLFRRATSSLRKKRTGKAAEENGHVQQIEPLASSETKMMAKMNEQKGAGAVNEEVEEGKRPTTMLGSGGSDEAGTSGSQQELRPVNFWSEPRSVVLSRSPNETFGISIVGGRVEVSQKGPMEIGAGSGGAVGPNAISSTVAGIFIKSVVADSPAGRCGQLFMGDRLLSVNNVDLSNSTHETAVQVIKSAQNPVTFRVQSLQTLQSYGSASNAKRPSQASIFSEKSEAERRAAASAAIIEIDAESAAALGRAEDDVEPEDAFRYTQKKVERKYGDLPGEPVLLRMANIPSGGLGLILSTKRDEEDEEHRPPVIVVGVKSDSPLSLNVGDELLEINGRVLFGLSHQEATEKIRHCCQHSGLSLLILRKKTSPNGGPQKGDNDSQQETLPRERKWTNESECAAGARQIVAEVLARQTGEDQAESSQNANAERKRSDDADHHNQAKENNNEIRPEENCRDRAKLSSETLKSAASAPGTLQSVGGAHNGGGNDAISRKRSWQMEQQQSQFLQKCPIQVGQETLIEIDKDGKGLGLSIVGGSDTVLGTVVIHEVYPDGAAAIDGRLKPGDQVLEVNSTSLRAISHEQAITLLRRTPAKVRLLIYRDQNLQMSLLDPTQIYNILTIDLVKKAGKGLGISIVGRKNEPGVYVSEIVKGGVADGDGRLMQGDQILAVNGQDVANCMQEDVATILKTSTGKIGLKIGRWKLTETAQKVRSAQPPNAGVAGGTMTAGTGAAQMNSVNSTGQMPLQQQQNINETASGPMAAPSDGIGQQQPNGTREPPPPAPMPGGGGGLKLPPPTLQITLHDENNQQQSLMGGVRSDLSPVSEEDLKSIAETVASEDQSAVTTSSSSQRRPLNQLPNTAGAPSAASASSAASSSSHQTPQPGSSQSNNHHHGHGHTAASSVKMRTDLKESGCDSLLIVLKKDDGQQWGMGIGKRPRGILITSLQPGSSAAEKLAIGDRIMAVNGQEVTTQHSAVTFIRSSGNSVALQISRPIKPFISS